MPAGIVTFLDGLTLLGTGTLSAGVATLIVSGLSLGTHAIAATYAGDATFNSSNSGNFARSSVRTISRCRCLPSVQAGSAVLVSVAALDASNIPLSAYSGPSPSAALTRWRRLDQLSGRVVWTVRRNFKTLETGPSPSRMPQPGRECQHFRREREPRCRDPSGLRHAAARDNDWQRPRSDRHRDSG